MTQTVPATAVLGPGATGLTIGYRVLNLDGTEYSVFTTDDVAETSVAGTYRKAGGVVVPATGGYIVWGTALVDYAEATVEPAPLKPAVAGRTLAVDGDGVASANVTTWAGDAVNDLVQGRVPANVQLWNDYDIGDTVFFVAGYRTTLGYEVMFYGDEIPAGTSGTTMVIPNSVYPTGTYDGQLLYVARRVFVIESYVLDGTDGTFTLSDALPEDLEGEPFVIVPSAPSTAIDGQDIAEALLLAPDGAAADGSAMAQLAAIVEDTSTTLPALISAGGSGTGLYSETITVNDGDDLPVDGVLVQVATDSAFSNIVRSGYTDNLGQVTLNFDAAGTYYGRAEISDFDVATFTVTISE